MHTWASTKRGSCILPVGSSPLLCAPVCLHHESDERMPFRWKLTQQEKTLRSAKIWRLGWSERTGKQILGTEVEIRKCSIQGSLCSDQLKVITLQFYSILTFFIFNMLFLMDSFNQFVLILKLPLEKFSVWVLCCMHRDVCAVAVFYSIS